MFCRTLWEGWRGRLESTTMLLSTKCVKQWGWELSKEVLFVLMVHRAANLWLIICNSKHNGINQGCPKTSQYGKFFFRVESLECTRNKTYFTSSQKKIHKLSRILFKLGKLVILKVKVELRFMLPGKEYDLPCIIFLRLCGRSRGSLSISKLSRPKFVLNLLPICVTYSWS